MDGKKREKEVGVTWRRQCLTHPKAFICHTTRCGGRTPPITVPNWHLGRMFLADKIMPGPAVHRGARRGISRWSFDFQILSLPIYSHTFILVGSGRIKCNVSALICNLVCKAGCLFASKPGWYFCFRALLLYCFFHVKSDKFRYVWSQLQLSIQRAKRRYDPRGAGARPR